jgi:5-methylcytosine-specific restriction endonuclease McrA
VAEKRTTTGRSGSRLDDVVARARGERDDRMKGYREMSLKLHPWVCGRCSREFTRENLQLLTVHHKDHNHDNNPLDGSNWENLCIYCHDNEHSRYIDHTAGGAGGGENKPATATQKPFSNLKDLLKPK